MKGDGLRLAQLAVLLLQATFVISEYLSVTLIILINFCFPIFILN